MFATLSAIFSVRLVNSKQSNAVASRQEQGVERRRSWWWWWRGTAGRDIGRWWRPPASTRPRCQSVVQLTPSSPRWPSADAVSRRSVPPARHPLDWRCPVADRRRSVRMWWTARRNSSVGRRLTAVGCSRVGRDRGGLLEADVATGTHQRLLANSAFTSKTTQVASNNGTLFELANNKETEQKKNYEHNLGKLKPQQNGIELSYGGLKKVNLSKCRRCG